jgi:hypothetical protein
MLCLAIVVVPFLFENSFRKMKDDSDASELDVEPIKLKRPTTNSEVALALRVLEGCCLLCKDCADSAYRYDAIKACGYITYLFICLEVLSPSFYNNGCVQVLLNILLSQGVLEQKTCLDALVALLVSSSANEMVLFLDLDLSFILVH